MVPPALDVNNKGTEGGSVPKIKIAEPGGVAGGWHAGWAVEIL